MSKNIRIGKFNQSQSKDPASSPGLFFILINAGP